MKFIAQKSSKVLPLMMALLLVLPVFVFVLGVNVSAECNTCPGYRVGYVDFTPDLSRVVFNQNLGKWVTLNGPYQYPGTWVTLTPDQNGVWWSSPAPIMTTGVGEGRYLYPVVNFYNSVNPIFEARPTSVNGPFGTLNLTFNACTNLYCGGCYLCYQPTVCEKPCNFCYQPCNNTCLKYTTGAFVNVKVAGCTPCAPVAEPK